MKVTLTDDEGHRWRSKFTKNELMVKLICRKLLHSQTSYLVPRYNTISDTKWHLSLFDFDLRSRSRLKVKGHRRGGVCVLWMLLVSKYFRFYYNFVQKKFVFSGHKALKVGANLRFLWRLADRWLSPPPEQDVSLSLETSKVLQCFFFIYDY